MSLQRQLRLRLIVLIAVASLALGVTSLDAQPKPSITLSPASGPGGTMVTVNGTNFTAGDTVSIEIVGNLENRPLTTAAVGQDGRFVATATLPVGGLYPERITLMAFPHSLHDRSAESLAQAPTAVFTVAIAGSPELPNTGSGPLEATRRVPAGIALALLLGCAFLLAVAVPRLIRRLPSH